MHVHVLLFLRDSGEGYSNSGRPSHFLVYGTALLSIMDLNKFLHVACNYHLWIGSLMDIFETRVLGENLSFLLKNQRF